MTGRETAPPIQCMDKLKRFFAWFGAMLCALLPGCVTNQDTGELEFSPASASRALRASQIISREVAVELEAAYPVESAQLVELADATDPLIAMLDRLAIGDPVGDDLEAQANALLDLADIVLAALDDDELRYRIAPIVRSLRIALQVAVLYSGEE